MANSIDIQYYEKQLERMSVKNNIVRFKFMDDNTNTNVMNLNLNSIKALEIFLQKSKKVLEKLKKD